MISAIFERSTQEEKPHVIVLDLGPGERHELTIDQAGVLADNLVSAVMQWLEYQDVESRR